MHRDYDLKHEVPYVILRLVQLRDKFKETHTGLHIFSVKYRGFELRSIPFSECDDLSSINMEDALSLCRKIGYERKRNVCGKVVSKVDVTVNDKNYSIRCLHYIDRPLINHSHRRKYEEVCNRINLPVEKLDKMVDDYWICRNMGVFNEDCHPYSSMNPFLDNHDYLKELLSFMTFHSFDYDYAFNDDRFVAETVDYVLDYVDPCDESTWSRYNPETYFDTVWPYLRFSLRDKKGMPSDDELDRPEYSDLWRWIQVKGNRRKGALHIRIERFDASEHTRDFKIQFETVHKKELSKVKLNIGELDEYLVKLFLVECRKNKASIPIGDTDVVVQTVGSKNEEYGIPPVWLDWEKQSPKMIVFICNEIKAGKSSAIHKSDVYVNGVGLSVKSRRGGAVTIVNQTSREKILRVMKAIHSDICPLDKIVGSYWNLRLDGKCGEDVSNDTMPDNPFSVIVNDNGVSVSNQDYLSPLLRYFAFDGSGTKDSPSPADYVLSVGLPDDVSTWKYFDRSNFVRKVWQYLVFSIRSKGLPQNLEEEMMPWVKTINGKEYGTLNVRVRHLPE